MIYIITVWTKMMENVASQVNVASFQSHGRGVPEEGWSHFCFSFLSDFGRALFRFSCPDVDRTRVGIFTAAYLRRRYVVAGGGICASYLVRGE